MFGSDFKADLDTVTNQAFLKNEVWVALVPKENIKSFGNEIIYNDNNIRERKEWIWEKIEDVTILDRGIVWRFRKESTFEHYFVLIKEFETFSNVDVNELNPEKNPTKRLTYGDVIEL